MMADIHIDAIEYVTDYGWLRRTDRARRGYEIALDKGAWLMVDLPPYICGWWANWEQQAPPAEYAMAPELHGSTLYLPGGWWCDGASGPALDTWGLTLAWVVHDALGQMRKNGCTAYTYQQTHRVYREVAIAQGTHRLRAWYHWLGLALFGGPWRWLDG